MTAASDRHDGWVGADSRDKRLTQGKRFVRLVFLLFAVLAGWSCFAVLDEVSTGTGRVVPTSQEQVVQSLEGGVLARLHVRQDDVVNPGQILAQLDPTVAESSVDESAAKYRAALASASRLKAEVNRTALVFPPELDAFPELKAAETLLYDARKRSLDDTLQNLAESRKLIGDELAISQSLSQIGAASTVEVIRLKRQLVELQLKETEIRATYIVQAREDLARANADVEALSSVIRGRSDSLSRLTLRSPVRGIVKSIDVSTIGGVVPPNGKLMVIVPLDEQLLIEARILPRDIAYIHPDQRATVKITAYDYAIYGGLEGKVVSISPDTVQDENQPDAHFYRVFIRTGTDALTNKRGDRFPIAPGMIAIVDIHTGSKTVFDYLAKPLNRAREALRER